MKYLAEVLITLKEGVRDPQGAAIDTVLRRVGIEENAGVQAGKSFTFSVTADNEELAREKVNKICEDILLNPILESYKIGRFEQL
ncbi:MAG: phosphoribosylformylglycinamidine synthase, purS protein [Candidatus Melainabacteria bacterium RIFOXYA12_FULL_32_12]|nr:MAG: phosphoribosylformylglycinamidine synthase, purS protein [Candidatus Melainabacteria bacterium RIFOXYA2_FULL_32_9]OGI28293.1 MAG: phosphoribosylformylglycinamidine synthase, purS protein [Candidatus Melainabacteria bacterium RIFOXYA12_FULL_32_12]